MPHSPPSLRSVALELTLPHAKKLLMLSDELTFNPLTSNGKLM